MLCGVPTPTKYVRCPPLPVYAFFQCCAVSPPHLFHSSRRYVRCPPLPVQIFLCGVPPPCNSVPLPHLALSWILSKVENLTSSSLPDEATDCFFTWPSLIINLAQLVSPSVALPTELVLHIFSNPFWSIAMVKIIAALWYLFSNKKTERQWTVFFNQSCPSQFYSRKTLI